MRACAVREWRWLAPTVLASRVSLQANNVLLTLRLVLTFEQVEDTLTFEQANPNPNPNPNHNPNPNPNPDPKPNPNSHRRRGTRP